MSLFIYLLTLAFVGIALPGQGLAVVHRDRAVGGLWAQECESGLAAGAGPGLTATLPFSSLPAFLPFSLLLNFFLSFFSLCFVPSCGR